MIAGRWFITPHAVDRFLERHDRSTGCSTRKAALAWMLADSAAATFAHRIAATGDTVWVGRRPWRVRYVIGSPPADLVGEPGIKPPVVTVMPARRGR